MAKRKRKAEQSGAGVINHGGPSSVHLGEETVPENRRVAKQRAKRATGSKAKKKK